MGRLITVAEFAELTTIAESTAYDWRARSIGPLSFKLNGRVVYDLDDVTAWIAAQRQASQKGKS
jgi:predicted DNA-binding transcriptional regulator AlpA